MADADVKECDCTEDKSKCTKCSKCNGCRGCCKPGCKGMCTCVDMKLVNIENPKELNMIIGQAHFIKCVEDLYEAMVTSSGDILFGIAFCEASTDRAIRFDGNSEPLKQLAVRNAQAIACGHTFIIFMEKAFPINCLKAVKGVQEVCNIFCATANPVQVVVAESAMGRGVMAVIDGFTPLKVEDEQAGFHSLARLAPVFTKPQDKKKRHDFIRMIGYKR